ncbi:MerR family transcriptional regulator [Paenibacillus sp. HJL G12]|uniref:MerR family transcriptional regulator n=1 Tax=Paenibacillus dendrobii TaxID=2691084 RepID=A0A7X3LFL1_9BACL|nr:MerR family transcriptional regulator [Paenibacillus dendrobii]MWV43791.1 MerR family transcriptional regulator [Paenibacillus dendrobii]
MDGIKVVLILNHGLFSGEVILDGDIKLYRIGELAKAGAVSERTIDYYTKLGLISPEKRTLKNYRLYSHETLLRLKRINDLKQEKYTLEEIRQTLDKWDAGPEIHQVSDKLTYLELHMQQLEREVKELSPLLKSMKPGQARHLLLNLLPQGAACIEAIRLFLEQGPTL